MEFILNKIKEYKKIVIFGHLRPDGDCIGSQYGLMNIIKASFPDKEVYVTGDTSEFVSFLGRPTHVDDEVLKGALGISVDCPNLDRLSDQRITECDYTIKIDHHIKVSEFTDYEYVDDKAPSCTQILTQFVMKFKNDLKLSYEAALPLYVGLVTDTGRFKFDSVTSDTFIVAAELLKYGLNLGEIDNKLSVETVETLKLRGYCLENFKVTEAGFAYLVMDRATITRFNVSDEDAANQVSAISTIKGCPVWALFIEYPDDIRIRLRSRGPVINTLAEKWNGGGHAKASGASLGSWDNLDKFIEMADDVVKEYKKTNEE